MKSSFTSNISKKDDSHVLFPVPKDLVEKLIKMYSRECGDCAASWFCSYTCDTCKKVYQPCQSIFHTQQWILLSERCSACDKYFCKNCANISTYSVQDVKYGKLKVCKGCFQKENQVVYKK